MKTTPGTEAVAGIPQRGGRPAPASIIDLSAVEWECLRACIHDDRERAAAALGLSATTVQRRLVGIYAKLDVHSLLEAYVAVGWLHLPDRRTGGWMEAA